MSEPDYLVQTAGAITHEAKVAWIRSNLDEARSRGITFQRVSHHDTIPNLMLFEGWYRLPDDEGEPRFQLVAQ